jgi:hypothetical protein
MTLILRRLGRGAWSPVRVTYDPQRQAEWPIAIDARIGARLDLFGVTYRISRIET